MEQASRVHPSWSYSSRAAAEIACVIICPPSPITHHQRFGLTFEARAPWRDHDQQWTQTLGEVGFPAEHSTHGTLAQGPRVSKPGSQNGRERTAKQHHSGGCFRVNAAKASAGMHCFLSLPSMKRFDSCTKMKEGKDVRARHQTSVLVVRSNTREKAGSSGSREMRVEK